MSVIANNLPKFENDIGSYNKMVNRLKSDYMNLYKHMVDLNGMWTGEAYETLMQNFAEDSKQAMSVLDFLEDFGKKLETADQEYAGCEKQVKQIIESINIQ